MKSKNGGNSGFLKIVVLIIIGIFILSAFKLNLRDVVNSPELRSNVSYAYSLVKGVWDNYLKAPVLMFWNSAFNNVIFIPFIQNMNNMISGQGTSTFFSLIPQFSISTSTSATSTAP
jgi:hypothetical protein